MSLFEALTESNLLSHDTKLLKELGIGGPRCPINKETFVGEVMPFADQRIPSLLPRVRIYATRCPATFFRFEITREYSDFVNEVVVRGIETVEVSTGSGYLDTFWPSVLLIANGMLEVRESKRAPVL